MDAHRPGGGGLRGCVGVRGGAHQVGHSTIRGRIMRTESRKMCYRTTVLGEFWPVLASFGTFSISFGAFRVGFERHFEARSASRAHRRGCAAARRDHRSGAHGVCGAGPPLVRHGRTSLKASCGVSGGRQRPRMCVGAPRASGINPQHPTLPHGAEMEGVPRVVESCVKSAWWHRARPGRRCIQRPLQSKPDPFLRPATSPKRYPTPFPPSRP